MVSLLAPYCSGCREIAGVSAAFTHGAILIGDDRGHAGCRLGGWILDETQYASNRRFVSTLRRFRVGPKNSHS